MRHLAGGLSRFQEGDVIECFSFEELPKALVRPGRPAEAEP